VKVRVLSFQCSPFEVLLNHCPGSDTRQGFRCSLSAASAGDFRYGLAFAPSEAVSRPHPGFGRQLAWQTGSVGPNPFGTRAPSPSAAVYTRSASQTAPATTGQRTSGVTCDRLGCYRECGLAPCPLRIDGHSTRTRHLRGEIPTVFNLTTTRPVLTPRKQHVQSEVTSRDFRAKD